jgi:glycosyltransferase involved in cell wall biosynthesis
MLRNLAVELDVESQVNFCGQVSREYLYENLRSYDLFILPSHYEGLGNVISEAMSAKLPVLCSDIDGPAELVGCGSRGYTFQVGNEKSCASAIMDIYANYGSSEMNKKIEQANTFAKEHLDVRSMVNDLFNTYDRVVSA